MDPPYIIKTTTAISDTFLFVMGVFIGNFMNIIFRQFSTMEETEYLFCISLVQIYLNASIIRFVRSSIDSLGLFVLGLIGFQNLLIRKLIMEL